MPEKLKIVYSVAPDAAALARGRVFCRKVCGSCGSKRQRPRCDRGPKAAFGLLADAAQPWRAQMPCAQAERGSIATNGHCSSLDDLISSGSLTLAKPERDGYTYQVNCSDAEFQVIAQHAPAPEGSPIRYPTISIDSNLEIKSN